MKNTEKKIGVICMSLYGISLLIRFLSWLLRQSLYGGYIPGRATAPRTPLRIFQKRFWKTDYIIQQEEFWKTSGSRSSGSGFQVLVQSPGWTVSPTPEVMWRALPLPPLPRSNMNIGGIVFPLEQQSRDEESVVYHGRYDTEGVPHTKSGDRQPVQVSIEVRSWPQGGTETWGSSEEHGGSADL